MGSFCGPSSQPVTTTQQQTYTPSPEIKQAGTQALTGAEQAAASPFQMPAAPVAPFSPFQQTYFNTVAGLQPGVSPFFAGAEAETGYAGMPTTGVDINQFMNPYAQASIENMNKYIFDPQRRQTMGNAVQTAGGVGADRLALTQQNLAKTQSDALNQALAGFYQPAITAAQSEKQRALQTASQWMNLQGGAFGAAGQMAGAGAQQQAQTQRELMSPYQLALSRLAYPFQTSQFLAGITGGLAPAFGGTTAGTGTTVYPGPSMFNQILGAGTAGVGMAGSMGAFGGGGGGYGTSTPNSPGAAMYYGDPTMAGFGPTYGADGGRVGYDDGGAVGDFSPPIFHDVNAPATAELNTMIPKFNLPMGGGQNTGAHLNLNPAPPSGGSQSSGTGDAVKMGMEAAQLAMMFANRGGSVGGHVGPYDFGQGFDDGGSIDLPPSEYADTTPTFAPPPTMPPSQAPVPMLPPGATPSSIIQSRFPQTPAPQQPDALPPGATLTSGTLPRTNRDLPELQYGTNRDMSLADMQLPRSQMPYPDATQRDWGQNLARSPWLSLVEAGAKMAQTVGPPGSAIGAGLQAGVGQLEKQRKELTTEEQINQKADALHRQAISELNKYTRMTPYQASEAKYHEDILKQYEEGIRGPKAGGQKEFLWQKKHDAWLALYPEDKRGALDYANGLRKLSDSQVAISAARQASTDLRDNPSLDKEERYKYWLRAFKEAGNEAASTPAPTTGETPTGGTKHFNQGSFTKIKPGPDSDQSTWAPAE